MPPPWRPVSVEFTRSATRSRMRSSAASACSLVSVPASTASSRAFSRTSRAASTTASASTPADSAISAALAPDVRCSRISSADRPVRFARMSCIRPPASRIIGPIRRPLPLAAVVVSVEPAAGNTANAPLMFPITSPATSVADASAIARLLFISGSSLLSGGITLCAYLPAAV